MSKRITVAALAVLVLALALPANAAIQATSVEVRGDVVDNLTGHFPDGTGCVASGRCTASWNAYDFAGFWYDLKNGVFSENMNILTTTTDNSGPGLSSDKRTINQKGLEYTATKQIVKYKVNDQKGLNVEHGLDVNGVKDQTTTSDGVTNVTGGGYYAKIGWQAQPYVSLNGKTNKLSKLIMEQETSDKKTLTIGETWDMGGGWTLSAQSIDARASPRQAWLVLSKDGVKKDDKIIQMGQVYSYFASVGGETDAPLFVTYVDSIFSGATSDMVQLKYTWVVDTAITEVKSSDKYGAMKVMDENLNGTTIRLTNDDSSISLSQDSTDTIMGQMSFKVADNAVPRFYPMVVRDQPGTYEVRGEVLDDATHTPNGTSCVPACTASWNAYNFAGFWYDLKNGVFSENMTILKNTTDNSGPGLSSDKRTVNQKGLEYTTTKQIVKYKVNDQKGLNVEHGLDVNGVKDQTTTSDGVTNVTGGGYYAKIGWQAQPYVSLNGKTNKLSKLIMEQETSDKKTLTIGETWDMGGGWTLSAQSIDARASPRQAWLVLSKDGVKKDDKIIQMGQVYSYFASTGGETDAPLFVTYVDSIFSGATSDMVQLKYTWVIDTAITEVKSSDKYGAMKVMDENLNGTTIRLTNDDSSISLSQDSTDSIMGEMNFVVADSATPRFYPKVDYQIGAGGPTSTGTVTGTVGPTGTGTAGPTGNATATPLVVTTTEVVSTAGKPPATATATPKEPGFEIGLAIAGLLAVAFLVLRQRK